LKKPQLPVAPMPTIKPTSDAKDTSRSGPVKKPSSGAITSAKNIMYKLTRRNHAGLWCISQPSGEGIGIHTMKPRKYILSLEVEPMNLSFAKPIIKRITSQRNVNATSGSGSALVVSSGNTRASGTNSTRKPASCSSVSQGK
jgi:hypothetical protein